MKDFTTAFLSNHNNFYLAENSNINYQKVEKLPISDITFYHISEVTFENKAPRREALENVIGSLRIEGINFVYLIVGDSKGVNFYFGVSKDISSNVSQSLSIYDIGEHVLFPSLKGNFRGSTITHVDKARKTEILDVVNKMEKFSKLEGVPGVNEDNDNFQGVDRLVDVMLGDEFAVAIIAKPLNKAELIQIENNLNNAYSTIVPFVKESIQTGSSTNFSKNSSLADGKTESKGTTHSKGNQEGNSTNKSINTGSNKSTTKGTTKGDSTGYTSGSSSNSSNSGESTGSSSSGTEGTTKGESTGSGTSKSVTITDGTSDNYGTSKTTTEGTSDGTGTSESKTVEFIKKEVQDWIKYLDETIFTRLDYGKGKGLFITSTFLATNQIGSLLKLENTMKSLYSGETGNRVYLESTRLDNRSIELDIFKNFQVPKCNLNKTISNNEIYARATLSQYSTADSTYLGSWISAKELSLIAGLPKKEIVGLGLREEVEFGLNINSNDDKDSFVLGKIVQSGQEIEVNVNIEKEVLNKHTFVTGVTGSGKTTTCQKILIDSQLPFLVIEPAKTEYRILTEQYDDLLIFTLGNDTVAPFRLNPFEFLPHESITSRVDMIKASLEANFDMEAAIPQLMETAIYECYKDYGWNISNNKNNKFENPFDSNVYAFPTLTDLLNKTEKVVTEQGFDDRLKNDYIGSIKARLQGLTIGSKGLMLNTKRSIDFKDLLDKKVVLEIEEVRSSAEKSLIIGFVLTNLIEAVKAKFYENPQFKHITLIEEAHRLLSKFTPGDSLNKKQSVETFTDMLAEVRKYGECLIISDQIPGKLAPEVLKNTNTKIVHKIFAGDDKEAIGNTMALSDEQKSFLSNLEVGRAILFTQGFTKAIQIKIGASTNTTGNTFISNEKIRANAISYYLENYKKGVFAGLQCLKKAPDSNNFEKYLDIVTDQNFLEAQNIYFSGGSIDKLREKIVSYSKDVHKATIVISMLSHYTKNLEKAKIAIEALYDHCLNEKSEFKSITKGNLKNWRSL